MTEALRVVRQFYSYLAEGNVPLALQLLSPDVQWTEAELSPYYAGVLNGPDAVVAKVLQPINADFDEFVSTPSDFVTEGPRVVSFGIYSGIGKARRRRLRVPFVHSWTVTGGLIRQFDQYTDSAAWNDALGLA